MARHEIISGRDIIVIGASAGGVEALAQLAAGIPADLPAAVFLVLHTPPYSSSRLPDILSRSGPLPAAHAQDGELIQNGRIYIAPPNHHLLLGEGVLGVGLIRLSLGPRVNHTRPAIDPLFLSAASVYGPRAVGVVLSGTLDDGTVGLMEIKRRGGLAVVQDPQEAVFASMPESALEHVAVDHILSASQMGPVLTRLAHGPTKQLPQEQQAQTQQAQERGGEQIMAEDMLDNRLEEMPPAQEKVERDIAAQERGGRDGQLSVFTCPECGGALWQANAGTLVRFRCHTGHTLSGATLLAEQAEGVEKSLWYAARSLRDKARLARQLAGDARQRGSESTAARFQSKADRDDAHADTLERMIESNAAINQAP